MSGAPIELIRGSSVRQGKSLLLDKLSSYANHWNERQITWQSFCIAMVNWLGAIVAEKNA
jgi:hypothetical protein